MRHLKVLGVALFALLAFALTATSAFATLPSILITLGGTYPLHMQFNDNGTTVTKLHDTSGNKVEGKGTLILLLQLQTELSSLGKFEALFLNVKASATKPCEQAGEKNKEEILTNGTFHVVYPSLTPSLTLGIAFLLEEVKFNCEKVKVKVRGCALSQITDPKTASEDVELATGTLLGDGNGKNILTKFDNAAGTGTIECKLEDEFGVEFVQAEEAIGEPIHLSTLGNKMFSIGPI